MAEGIAYAAAVFNPAITITEWVLLIVLPMLIVRRWLID